MSKVSKNGKIEIMILVLVTILGTVFTVFNTGSLKKIINDQSMKYVNDINIELGHSINETIERVCVELESMTFGLNSYVTNYSEEEQTQKIEYFLKNREELLEYESLVFMMNDRKMFNNKLNIDLLHTDVVQDAFAGNEGVLAQDGYLIYATPVLGLSKEINGVLVGINSADTIQEMIKPNAINEDAISLILDRNIEIVVEPQNGRYPLISPENILRTANSRISIMQLHRNMEYRQSIWSWSLRRPSLFNRIPMRLCRQP